MKLKICFYRLGEKDLHILNKTVLKQISCVNMEDISHDLSRNFNKKVFCQYIARFSHYILSKFLFNMQ